MKIAFTIGNKSLEQQTTIPAGLNVPQNVEPWTSTSLPDHIGCNVDSYEVTDSEGFPASHHQVSTRHDPPMK